MKSKTLLRLPQDHYLIKSIRADENDYFRQFIIQCTRTPSQQHAFPLRIGDKRAFTVDGSGVYKRSEKKPHYTKMEKLCFSKATSTTLTSADIAPNVFGHDRERSDRLTGLIFSLQNCLMTKRLYLYDGGTLGRPYDHHTQPEAEAYFHQKVHVEQILFSDLESFKEALSKPENQGKVNEVLARVKWNMDGSTALFIASDNLETRLLAQDRARILLNRLKEYAHEMELPWDELYQVPLCFYLPSHPKHLTWYDEEAQLHDRAKAIEIINDPVLRDQKCATDDFEFLLMSDNPWQHYTKDEWVKLTQAICDNRKDDSSVRLSVNYQHIAFTMAEKMDFFKRTALYKKLTDEALLRHNSKFLPGFLAELLILGPVFSEDAASDTLIEQALTYHQQELAVFSTIETMDTHIDDTDMPLFERWITWCFCRYFLQLTVNVQHIEHHGCSSFEFTESNSTDIEAAKNLFFRIAERSQFSILRILLKASGDNRFTAHLLTSTYDVKLNYVDLVRVFQLLTSTSPPLLTTQSIINYLQNNNRLIRLYLLLHDARVDNAFLNRAFILSVREGDTTIALSLTQFYGEQLSADAVNMAVESAGGCCSFDNNAVLLIKQLLQLQHKNKASQATVSHLLLRVVKEPHLQSLVHQMIMLSGDNKPDLSCLKKVMLRAVRTRDSRIIQTFKDLAESAQCDADEVVQLLNDIDNQNRTAYDDFKLQSWTYYCDSLQIIQQLPAPLSTHVEQNYNARLILEKKRDEAYVLHREQHKNIAQYSFYLKSLAAITAISGVALLIVGLILNSSIVYAGAGLLISATALASYSLFTQNHSSPDVDLSKAFQNAPN